MNFKIKITLISIIFFITLGFGEGAFAATTRYYFGNAAAPYSPASLRGTWNLTTGYVNMALGAKAGAAATRGLAETSTTNPYHVMLGRWVSAGLASDVNFKTTDTVSWIVGVVESSGSLNGYFKVYAYVTTGDSDTVRGVLLDYDPAAGGTEFTTTATGRGEGSMVLLNNVSAQAGDRVVVEIGYNARNAVATSYSATMNYGNTGTTDLAQGNTTVTTRPGWIEFIVVDLPTVTTQAASDITGATVTANGNITATGGANSTTRGFVYDTVSRTLPGNVAPGSSGYASNSSTSGSYGTGAYTASLSSLASNTTYYIRSFSQNPAGYSYGNEISFKTLRRDVFFSVGQNTTSHETGAGNVTVSGTTATFTVDQNATNMGVGDVINYDSDNKLCYISARVSPTVWTCTSATGGSPTSATGVAVNSISHAFNSLSAAEAGAPTLLGSSDLTTLNIQLNFPCYYDSGADTTIVNIDGFTTDAARYIRIFTPNNVSTEANTNQRHSGKWDTSKYRLVAGINSENTIAINDYHVYIDGLQVESSATDQYGAITLYTTATNNQIEVSNNIIRRMTGDVYGGSNYISAINLYPGGILNNAKIYNNIIYGFTWGINARGANVYIYNNTIVDCYNRGIQADNTGSPIVVKNSIVQNIPDGFVANSGGTFASSSDYNISDVASDAPGANSKNSTEVSFVDEANDDFHLALTETDAIDTGVDLRTDANFAFSTDIDGQGRKSSTNRVGSDDFATNPSTRWTNLVNSMTWGSGAYSSDTSQDYAVYNNPTSTTTQYVKVNAYESVSNGSKGVVMRSTGTASDGFYSIVTGQADNNAWITYANASGWVEDMASASLPYAFSTTSPGDSIGFTIEGSGTGTVARIWVNPVNNAPFSPSAWDSIADAPDVTITLASYAGSNFANTGKYVGLGSWNAVTYDNFYGGSFDTTWDIGADEVTNQIYRSLAPGSYGAIADDAIGTLTISGSTATFSADVLDNVGVGDFLAYDTNNNNTFDSGDSFAFIYGRTDSTHFTVKTQSGGVPNPTTTNDAWAIYRAYVDLDDAEDGTINSNITGAGISFTGGDRDLLTNNEVWNIACYANQKNADTTAVTISGWTTGVKNNLKIFTPYLSSEVGVSQRHTGKWDESKYHLTIASDTAIVVSYQDVQFDGIQLYQTTDPQYPTGINLMGYREASVSNSIIRGYGTYTNADAGAAIWVDGSSNANYRIYNNILYDFNNQFDSGVTGVRVQNSGYVYAYNNTVYNARYGFLNYEDDQVVLKNNIAQDCVVGYVGTFNSASDYNISDDNVVPGTNSKDLTNVEFINETVRDFHLTQTDTAARQAGTNLTADADLPINIDTDGQLRNATGTGWDIGADEGTKEFVTTVMQTGGNFASLNAWEDAVDSELAISTTRVFSHGGITGTIIGGNTVTGLTSGATATVVYTTSTQILLRSVSGTFQSGETVQVSAGNSVVISDNGNPASATAKIDGAWTIEDTTPLDIDGWMTGHDNYVRVYTASAARHAGKWDDTKYRMYWGGYSTAMLNIHQEYVTIDGIQMERESDNYPTGIGSGAYYVTISNNIIKSVDEVLYSPGSGIHVEYDRYYNKIYNNIVYGYNGNNGGSVGIYAENREHYIYNNTVFDSDIGISGGYAGDMVARNNLIQNCDLPFDSWYNGAWGSGSDYNITDGLMPPGANSKSETEVSFFSTTLGSEDLHLALDDTTARDAGVNLSADSGLAFNTDIDGKSRDYLWDVGADETATQIYRSVGSGQTDLLESDDSHGSNIVITNGVATLAGIVAYDYMGVGDVLIVDMAGTDQTIDSADTLLFISGRVDETHYIVRTQAGELPANIATNDTWQIYRAYTSLANAESGTINSTLSGMGFSFSGGNRDILVNNEQWNIACYANWPSVDTTAVVIDGWTTGLYNILKIYTPVGSKESAVTERHTGKWDTNEYILNPAAEWGVGSISLNEQYVRIEGLQIGNTALNQSVGIVFNSAATSSNSDIYINNNIIRNTGGGGSHVHYGIWGASILNSKIFNNVIYDFDYGIDLSWIATQVNVSIYNNTIMDCAEVGIGSVPYNDSTIRIFNNIVQGTSTTGNYYVVSPDYSGNNISEDATSPDGASFRNKVVAFVDEANNDFHLLPTDTVAKNAGTDLSTYFNKDIDGASRPGVDNSAWDIGADEYSIKKVFYSVGQTNTSNMVTGSPTLGISNGVGTFSVAQTDNIGVGDRVSHFPSTDVIDDFNRADTTGGYPSEFWRQIYGGINIDTNAIVGTNMDPDINMVAYRAKSFSADQEAYYTINTKNSSDSFVAARITDVSWGTYDGYRVYMSDYVAGTDQIEIYRVDDGVSTQLGAAISQEVSNGDSIGIKIIGNDIAAYYKPAAGNWTMLGYQYDATYTAGGYIGIGEFHASGVGSILDNFAGGDVAYSHIAGKTSQTQWNLVNKTGEMPVNVSGAKVDYIMREFNSLSSAVSNADDATHLNTGNLFDNNYELNIPCYYDNGIDTAQARVDGYNTGVYNPVKIYTPNNISTEANYNQRHTGKWEEHRYSLQFDPDNTHGVIEIADSNIIVDGLQISLAGNPYSIGILNDNTYNDNTTISNNIIRGTNQNDNKKGISSWGGDMNVSNNVIYGFSGINSYGFSGAYDPDDNGELVYNNTVYDAYACYRSGYHTALYMNNIAQNCSNDGFDGYDPDSNYNISDRAGDAPGANSKNSTTVSFVDLTNRDFHLTQSDTAARQSGTNLTNDAYLKVTNDIDGHLRNPAGTGWDIGADEGTKEFVTTVMQTGGNFASLNAWEDGVDSDLVADTTRVFSHGGITGAVIGGSTITGLTSGATATVVYATSTQILLRSINGNFQTGEVIRVSTGNQVTISDNGNPASAVAMIDGVWSGVDSTEVNIDGWGTGHNNYIKVYTTSSARHGGKWDNSKYWISKTVASFENYVTIDGLQSYLSDNVGNGTGIYGSNVISNVVSNNILKFTDTGDISWDPVPYGIFFSGYSLDTYIFNNIVYDMIDESGQYGLGIGTPTSNYNHIYNNTVVNCLEGFANPYGYTEDLKNNIAYGNVDNYNGVYDNSSTNNLSGPSQNDAPGLNPVNNAGVVFVDYANDDFHLSQTDAVAKNAGADLSTIFNTDIDGATRNVAITPWDIGADESSTQIFRSVAAGATGTLENDDSHSHTVEITGGVALFSLNLPSRVGVGDVLIVDTAGTNQTIDSADTLLFISGRTDTTHYNVRTHTGATPANIASNDTWQIYRAHTSLFDAEAGTPNASLTSLGFTFNGGNRDLMANNEEWNITAYANGITPDATALEIDGWNTGVQNFIKIYTPVSANEVGLSQRHSGKSSYNKYFFQAGGKLIQIRESNVTIDGLQIDNNAASNNAYNILNDYGEALSNIKISNNILTKSGAANGTGAIWFNSSGNNNFRIFNNIMYGWNSQAVLTYTADNGVYLYDNTIYNCGNGYMTGSSDVIAKNNIAQNCTDGYVGTFATGSDYNISDLAADAPGANSKNSTNVTFLDEANNDFHLSQSDTSAKNAGTSLASEGSYFATDIDGAPRNTSINAWDIGADETATQIYRSVSPGETTSLFDNSGGANTITISSGTATFVSALPDNIGVGDVILYDSNNSNTLTSADSIAFIQSRTSSTVYTIRTQTGAVMSNLPANDHWAIYRAHASLFDAEAGIINSTLSGLGITFNGGNRDLVTNNEEWNIATYANGTTADTTAVNIEGWNSATQNFIKVYTPVSSSEVGASQRHDGKWDDGKYNLSISASNYILVYSIGNIVIDGLQMKNTKDDENIMAIGPNWGYSSTGTISNNIIVGPSTGSSSIERIGFGMSAANDFTNIYHVYNNIFYDWLGDPSAAAAQFSTIDSGSRLYYSNNTFYNCNYGIWFVNDSVMVRNNIFQNIILRATESYDPAMSGSGYNVTDTSAVFYYWGSDRQGTNNKSNTSVAFVNEAGDDLHLAQSDTGARESGTNLTNDTSYPVTIDIDGQLRNPSGVGWDIGADEGTKEFVATVMQTGGNFASLNAWEDAIDSDLVASTTRVFSHGGITGTIIGGNTVTGLTSGATATVVYATSTQILLRSVSGIFQTGEAVRVNASNYVTISDNGNPASAVAMIDGAWSVADSIRLTVDGSVTGADNYIKIYTTSATRHSGKWDDTKYRLSVSDDYIAALEIFDNYVRIEGLQVEHSGGALGRGAIVIDELATSSNSSVLLDSDIIRTSSTNAGSSHGVNIGSGRTIVRNSLIYSNYRYGIWAGYNYNSPILIVENSVIAGNGGYGMGTEGNLVQVKNSYFGGNTLGTYQYTSDNVSFATSACSDNTIKTGLTPNVAYSTSTGAYFTSITSGSEDFHIKSTSVLKDAGTDLSTYFNIDIDGANRLGTWDIGADEAATQIFRSVAPSATGILDSDNSHADDLQSVTSGVATFEVDLPDNIGVGDVLIVDTAGTANTIDSADTLLFISGRTDSTHYGVRTHNGAIPANITINDTWQIYRAHTSLFDAEAGTPNASLTSLGFTFNGGDRDLMVNNEQWNISAYANGTTADTIAVNIDGWDTGAQNFIKVYTPIMSSEVGISQRHNGKWNDDKYKFSRTCTGNWCVGIQSVESYVVMDGLQVDFEDAGYTNHMYAINLYGEQTLNNKTVLSNNILRSVNDAGTEGGGVGNYGSHSYLNADLYNNIVYGFNAMGVYFDDAVDVRLFNNTIYSCELGGMNTSGYLTVNNLSINNGGNDYSGATWTDPASTNNISSDGTADDGLFQNGITNVVTSGIFIDVANGDFHLVNNSIAKNAGTDLSTYFNTDIDGAPRNTSINTWDIGADETATQIYRSVSPGATSSLANNSGGANTITISSGGATFVSALPDNVGVGDVILYDSNNSNTLTSADSIAFIQGRTSSTVYTIRTQTGAVTANLPANDYWAIYRAHTSLSNAEEGTINSTLSGLGITFNGGNRDLVTNNEEWDIAAYKNSSTVDVSQLDVNGWNSGMQNNLRFYTPFESSEVGISQRHSGIPGTGYIIENTDWVPVYIGAESARGVFVDFEGFEVKASNANVRRNISVTNISSSFNVEIKENLIYRTLAGSDESLGISSENLSLDVGTLHIYNNIIFDIDGAVDPRGIRMSGSHNANVYNNTVYNIDGIGIYESGTYQVIKNNIVQNTTSDAFESWDGFSASDNYNISSDGTVPGANSKSSTNVEFVNEAGKDFHLAQTDTAARESGDNLTSEFTSYGLLVATDIDGQLRNPSGVGWDIGADEGTKEFVTTVMQAGGNFASLNAWEDAIDSDLVASTTRVFSHGGITGTIIGGNTVTGLTSGATATVVYATSTQILLRSVSGIFQSGETMQVSAGNSVVISDNGNPASAVAMIDGAWTNTDTSNLVINGWETKYNNYIKIYTTSAARHSGKWDVGKYRLTATDQHGISSYEGNVSLEGLQISLAGTAEWRYGIVVPENIILDNISINSNIIRDASDIDNRFGLYLDSYFNDLKIYNNIIYNFSGTNSYGYYLISEGSDGGNIKLQSNTFYNNNLIYSGWLDVIAQNNISQACIGACYTSNGSYYLTTNNISSDGTASGTNSKTGTTVSFVSTASGAEDLHLSQSDTAAKDSGVSLVSYFTTDIDGSTRVGTWDIGADEAATQIFRSVAPGATGILDSDNSHADDLQSVTSGVATFEVDLPDNIGVGDVLIVDTAGTANTIDSADTLLFISGRTDATHYNVRTHTGAIPANITINDTWQIYRAYIYLSDAEDGTINPSLTSLGFTFNGGDRDLMVNNEQWNILAYANGTTRDPHPFNVDGWITGAQNFIKVYSPQSTSEVGANQRHNGKWDENKYFIAVNDKFIQGTPIQINDNYIKIDGLQINAFYDGLDGTDYQFGIDVSGTGSVISGNIVRKNLVGSQMGVNFNDVTEGGSVSIYDNIIYDFEDGLYSEHRWDSTRQNAFIYNNTFVNCGVRVRYNTGNGAGVYLVNNVVKNSTTNYFFDNINSSYNISSDDTADDIGGTGNKINQNTLFLDEVNDDFHLSQSDTSAKNAGTDLSTYFTTDIDGAPRNTSINAWDIGADETATQIYRSVSPGATSSIANNSGGANTITISSGGATFVSALPDNVGVGDVILYDSNDSNTLTSADSIAFIQGRTSSTVYTIRTQTGAVMSNLPANDYWAIYRAHTSLNDAEAGIINSTLSGLGITFNGGNRDLVTNNEEWNIAAYANGTTVDTVGVDINGWNTAQQNFIKVYTPVISGEVGTSQRHNGKWDDGKYRLQVSAGGNNAMLIWNGYVKIEGLQMALSDDTGSDIIEIFGGYQNEWSTGVDISSNILRGGLTIPTTTTEGIVIPSLIPVGNINISNNVIYDIGTATDSRGIYFRNATINNYVYNNTIENSNVGFYNYNGNTNVALINNITQNCTDGYYTDSTWDPVSDYNISDLATDSPGTNSKNSTNVEFVNEAGKDFHLSQTDTAARQAGMNLTADASLSVTTDIDGQLRNPSGVGWDIGADEGTKEFVATVMQTGGNFASLNAWEDAIDSDLVASTTRVFSHGGITGTIIGGNTVTGLTSGATATVVYATSTQILLRSVSGNFQTGETIQVSSGNSVAISDNGNPASAVAKIDGAWTSADTSLLAVDGWITGGDNYIKIYTTPPARHNGKWNDGKYRFVSGGGSHSIYLEENHTTIDGIQLRNTSSNTGINVTSPINHMNGIQIKNNIITSSGSGTNGVMISCWRSMQNISVFNNVIYNFDDGAYFDVSASYNINIMNNTFYGNSDHGIYFTRSGGVLKNNIVQGTGINYRNLTGSFLGTSSHNISSDATAPGSSGSKINAEVEFVSTTSGSEDFHLASNDRFAIDGGTSLASDGAFTTDIDGMPRAGSWDIGADETATAIYRSVGPNATGLLASDNSHANTVTLTGGRATFSASIADNIGVGDVVIIDSNNSNTITSADTLLFISKRNSATSYQLQATNGSTPGDISVNDTYQIYRAYTSLYNAEAGTINSTLSGLGFSFTGGNRDLVANNEQWNIACYANGTISDPLWGIDIDGWNTGENNFIKIYTPVNMNEVGISQRHNGVWDINKFFITKTAGGNSAAFSVVDDFVTFDGIQLEYIADNDNNNVAIDVNADVAEGGTINISNSIIRGQFTGTSSNCTAILTRYHDTADSNRNINIYNNIIYGFQNGSYSMVAVSIYSGWRASIYNNTIYDSYYGINNNTTRTTNFVKNNIIQNSTNGYNGAFDASSDYNISDLAADAPGTNSKNSTNVLFIDEANDDFRLSSDDTAAKGAGLNLSTDTSLSFTDDIRGQSRPKSPDAWSIGACEDLASQKIKLEGTQVKMEGNMKFE